MHLKQVLVLCLAATGASGETFLSNLDGNDATFTSLNDGTRSKAMGFTIGSSPITLSSVTLRLEIANPALTTMDVALFSDSGSAAPGSRLVTLDNPVITATGIANYSFTAPSPVALTTSSSYWIVARDLGSATASRWMASSPAVTPTDPFGSPAQATHLGTKFSTGGTYPPSGASSTLASYALISVPEPAETVGLVGLGLGAFAWVRQRRRHGPRC